MNGSDYHRDWGRPSLAGVLAVHMLPGLLLPAAIAWEYWRRRGKAQRTGRS